MPRDDQVSDIGPSLSHIGKSRVTRSIQECNWLSIHIHRIGTDMLSNPTGFTFNHIRLAEGIQ